MEHRLPPGAAVMLALAFALVPQGAAAQSSKLEAVYVVLGAQGAVARAVLSDTTQCPAIVIDGARQAMSVRALPDTGPNAFFPVLVCELPLPAGAAAASIENSPLPVPKPALKSVAAFGDTGCRLKAKKGSVKAKDQDDEDRGKFQNCNVPSLWPFAQLAASVAAARTRPSSMSAITSIARAPVRRATRAARAVPTVTIGRPGRPISSPPAAPALLAAPWIVVRGNHEICKRAGAGYFRLLDPTPAQAGPPCAELIRHYTVTVAGQSFIVLDSSNAADTCPCDTAAYAAEFAAMRPTAGTWLVSHRPIWGFRSHRKTINATLQQALPNGRLPEGIALALAGHIHVWEALSFADKRPPQFVLGTGGTLLTGKVKGNLTGEKIGGTTVSYGRARPALRLHHARAGGARLDGDISRRRRQELFRLQDRDRRSRLQLTVKIEIDRENYACAPSFTGTPLSFKQALQFAGLEHLADDVAAADELALDVELRDGRPVRIGLDAVAQIVRFQHVQPFVGHAEVVEDLHDLARRSRTSGTAACPS